MNVTLFLMFSTLLFRVGLSSGNIQYSTLGANLLHSSKRWGKPVRLSNPTRDTLLNELASTGWKVVDGRDAIQKSFNFTDFVSAFGFMSQCALHAEKRNHHPEWFNVYNRVDVTLSTHDCDGLSQQDVDLAQTMDSISANFKTN